MKNIAVVVSLLCVFIRPFNSLLINHHHKVLLSKKSCSSASSSSSSALGIGGLAKNLANLGGGGNKEDGVLPRDVKEAVSQCRASVQEALQNRMSRMDIEMPVGTKFGVEKVNKQKKGNLRETPTKNEFDVSDRELARIFVEMFQPLGGTHISVIFNEDTLSDTARKKWKNDPSASCQVMSMGRRGSKKAKQKKKKSRGFAAMIEEEVGSSSSSDTNKEFRLPDGTELAIFVAPGPKELIGIEKICNEVGMGTLVVLLNARLSNVEKFHTENAQNLFLKEFEPVFHLRAANQDIAPGCLLHRSYPSGWTLARKLKVGQPKVLLSQKELPTLEECRVAHDSMELSSIEKGVDTALDKVFGWFR